MASQISFIIPVLNGEKHIKNCLEHIEREMLPEDEIIVVDNGSTDRTEEIVRKHDGVAFLQYPNVTIAALRNRGASMARGSVLAFIDSDVLIKSGWREAVEHQLEEADVGGTGSVCELPESPTWVERAWYPNRGNKAADVNYIPSGNLVLRRDAFEALTGFDESLITDEDCELCARLQQKGYRLVNDPSVRAIHLGNSKTVYEFFRRQKWHATSIVDSFSFRQPDRAMIMTFIFIAMSILSISVLSLNIPWIYRVAISASLLLLTPVTTTLFRISQHHHYQLFFQLVLLYSIFYLVRVIRIIQRLFRPNKRIRAT